MSLSFKHITFREGQQKRLKTAIADPLAPIPPTRETIPGIGPVFWAGLSAEIGPLARFDFTQAKVAKFAGLRWRKAPSDAFEAEHTPLSRTGNRYLRSYFWEAANAVRMHDADDAAYDDRKYHQGPKQQQRRRPPVGQRALVLTARKLVRRVGRLRTTHQPYRPRRAS